MSNQESDALGAEFSSAILAAITDNDMVPTHVRVSVDEQIQYVMKHTGLLQHPERVSVGKILIKHDRKTSLLPAANGTVINMDQLPGHIIDEIYEFVSYKINNQ